MHVYLLILLRYGNKNSDSESIHRNTSIGDEGDDVIDSPIYFDYSTVFLYALPPWKCIVF